MREREREGGSASLAGVDAYIHSLPDRRTNRAWVGCASQDSRPEEALRTITMAATDIELLQGAQLRLEQQQMTLQSEMHRMEEALTAKLDALLAASGNAPGRGREEQADCAPAVHVVDEVVPTATGSGVAERAVPAGRATRRVKLADLPHNAPAARSERTAGVKFSG